MKRLYHLDSFRISTNPKFYSGLRQFIPKFKLISRILFFCFFFAFHILHLTFDLYSQQPTQEWVARYTGPSNDLYGPFLQVDKEGNSYIAGTHVINDSVNILCAKYNTNGVQLWAALYKYPGYGYFTPSGLALDTFGNAYVTSGYALNTFVPQNILLVKFSVSNGSVVWAKNYTGQFGNSYAYDIKTDTQNNIYLAGASDSSHLLIKYNTSGDSVWVRKSRLPFTREVTYACTIDDSLNVIVTGSRSSCVPPPQQGCPFDTVLTAKYSPGGELRWLRTYRYGSDLTHSGRKITSDQNGSVYIGGVTRVSGFGVFLIMKYDRNGALQWGKIYDAPGTGDNALMSIAMDKQNNFLFVSGIGYTGGVSGSATTIKYNASSGDSVWVRLGIGSTYSSSNAWNVKVDSSGNSYIAGGATLITSSTSDFMTLKYLSQGDQAWLTLYNGPFNGTDGGRILELDNFRNVYVLGYSQNAIQVTDYVIIKYSQFLGIHPVTNEIPASYKLNQNYPNPFNPVTTIRFSIPITSFVQLRVFDVLGKLKELPVNESISPAEYEIKINGAGYSNGVYFYQLIADGSVVDTKKFVVLK